MHTDMDKFNQIIKDWIDGKQIQRHCGYGWRSVELGLQDLDWIKENQYQLRAVDLQPLQREK